jgi:hypothetical protein
MDPSWQLRYQQLEQARNCSGSSRQEQLNILDRALKILKRDILFNTALKFAASCLGMLSVVPTNVTRPITVNQTMIVQDILETGSKIDFILFRRVIFFALMIYAARSLWNGWNQLKLQKQFMEELERSKTA